MREGEYVPTTPSIIHFPNPNLRSHFPAHPTTVLMGIELGGEGEGREREREGGDASTE